MIVSAQSLSDTTVEIFRSRFSVGERDACWPWKGKPHGGYGRFKTQGRSVKATQLSWSLHNGVPFPEGKIACHSCDNPICVNPHHIWPGTKSENAIDAVLKNRVRVPTKEAAAKQRSKMTCKRGHPLFGENLINKHGGKRGCKICSHAFAKKYRDAVALRNRISAEDRARGAQGRGER